MEYSWNNGGKTKYYLVIFDWLQGHSRGLIRTPESCVRGPLIPTASLLSFSVPFFTSSMPSHFSGFQFPSTAVAIRLCASSTLLILL